MLRDQLTDAERFRRHRQNTLEQLNRMIGRVIGQIHNGLLTHSVIFNFDGHATGIEQRVLPDDRSDMGVDEALFFGDR